ncbi:MAG: leucine-rich repeat domain-containing protein [Eubacteriales bacterium]|nr:leucine-rich repeat domain-containing protein [Eubacteriales bacterium]
MAQTRCMRCMQEYKKEYGVCPFCGYVSEAAAANPLYLPEGTVLDGKYMIGTAVGHGGFGITYVAFDLALERKVAIKEYFPSGLSTRTSGNLTIFPFTMQDAEKNYRYGRDKFIEEARTLARFSSLDSIVSVLTCFTENNTAYIVMEYLDGEDLMKYVKRQGGRIGWDETLRLTAPVFDALTAIHAAGMIHRDISPDNIFLTSGGETKLLDFGTARFAMGEKSKSLSVILKPGYAPPEQYTSRGKQGPWTDIYALAATIYRVVTGGTPADAVERQLGTALERPGSLGTGISKTAEAALIKALELEPEKRLQTIEEFRQKLFPAQRTRIQMSDMNTAEGMFYQEPTPGDTDEYHQKNEFIDETDGNMIHMRKMINDKFDDYALEDEIRALLLNEEDDVFDSDMKSITELDAPNKDIKSIEVLYYCTAIEKLNLSDNKIKDIYPLEGLVNLKSLDLSYNRIKDIDPLEELTQLERLDLCENKISDIFALEGLTNIRQLYLSGNKVKNMDVLSGLKSLKALHLNETGIKDISFLEMLASLEELLLFNNDIEDFGFLPGLKQLQILDLSDTLIKDIGMLSDMTRLRSLFLDNIVLYDIGPLAQLTKMERLSISYNYVKDLNPLKSLANIKDLDLRANDIDDCRPLSGLRDLEKLDLRDNCITDIQTIPKLPNLKSLMLSGNPIDDYGPLKEYYGKLPYKDF